MDTPLIQEDFDKVLEDNFEDNLVDDLEDDLENVEDAEEDCSVDSEGTECAICREIIEEGEDVVVPCNCTFPKHRECLEEWIRVGGNRNICEICREPYRYKVTVEEVYLLPYYFRGLVMMCYSILMALVCTTLMLGKDGFISIGRGEPTLFVPVVILLPAFLCSWDSAKDIVSSRADWNSSHVKDNPIFWSITAIIFAISLLCGMLTRKYAFGIHVDGYWRFLNWFFGSLILIATVIILGCFLFFLVKFVSFLYAVLKELLNNGFHNCLYHQMETRRLANEDSRITDEEQGLPDSEQ